MMDEIIDEILSTFSITKYNPLHFFIKVHHPHKLFAPDSCETEFFQISFDIYKII